MIDTVGLLRQLIATPSVSGNEDGTASLLANALEGEGVAVNRLYNNVWATQPHYDATKPTLLLNSHHDTVKPSPAYTRDPFEPTLTADGRLPSRILRVSYFHTSAGRRELFGKILNW